jgi:class 3 adenylate cyclase
MIPDEPVRGRTPPPWVGALSGIERCRAYSRGLLPATPMGRLFGCRSTHVAAGTITLASPTGDATIAANGQIEITAPMIIALEGACHTALPAGFDIAPLRFTLDPFRPAWPGRGNLLCRARVVNSGDLFVFSVVQVEDSEGRHIAQGSLHAAVMRIEPPPPPPPANLSVVQEPVYETPDPYLREFPVTPIADLLEREDGMSLLRRFTQGEIELPLATMYGLCLDQVTDQRVTISMPASEWFCSFGPHISAEALGALANMAVFTGMTILHRPGSTMAFLGSTTNFLRYVPADGRRIRAEIVASQPSPQIHLLDVTIRNADGEPVARSLASVTRVDASRRNQRSRKPSRRVLATLLFTDIVDSTTHANQLGDAAWRALLEEYRLKVRREISRFNGTEIDNAGDGFFVRFDSPAYAIKAARAANIAVSSLGLQLRSGIHTGECEMEGSRLAGMAVHIAARIMAEAAPGEILASSTVKELTGGSGFSFTDRGERRLKGVPESWRLLAIVD